MPTDLHQSSQCDRILAALQDDPGAELAMPYLAQIGSGEPGGFCMVHSRIADLRRLFPVLAPAQLAVGRRVFAQLQVKGLVADFAETAPDDDNDYHLPLAGSP